MNRKYLLIKSVEIYVEQITDHWYSIRPPRPPPPPPPRPVEKLCASETVEYAFKKVEQLWLFKGASLRVLSGSASNSLVHRDMQEFDLYLRQFQSPGIPRLG